MAPMDMVTGMGVFMVEIFGSDLPQSECIWAD